MAEANILISAWSKHSSVGSFYKKHAYFTAAEFFIKIRTHFRTISYSLSNIFIVLSNKHDDHIISLMHSGEYIFFILMRERDNNEKCQKL